MRTSSASLILLRALRLALLVAIFFALSSALLCVSSSLQRCADAFGQELDLSALDDDARAATDDAAPPVEAAPSDSSSVEVSSPPSSVGRARFLDLLLASGWIGLVLLAASIVAVSLIIRLALALRRSSFIPLDLARELRDRLSRRELDGALQLANESPSFVGAVVAQGLKESSRGWTAIEKAVEDAAADYASRTFRRSEPLATIGNVAPMLGLLGTVIGMVTTFGEIAVSDGSGRNLANGIYFALVTTVDGLIVAIPALVAHSMINARIATLVSEGIEMINAIFDPLKPGASQRVATREDASASSTAESAPTLGLREIPSDRSSARAARPRQRPALTLPPTRTDPE